MPKPETLVILTPAFPENEADDNWVPTVQLTVKALKGQFPEKEILVLAFSYPNHASRYDWNGIRVVSFNGAKYKGRWRRPFFWREIWNELRHIRKECRIIGIFSFWCGECAFIGHYFGLVHSLRHRCWICGQDAQKENKWVRFIRPRARELVAISNFLRRTFHENHGIEPAVVIPNGVDQKLFDLPGEQQQRDIDILGAGSLVPLKQYRLLVQTIASLHCHFPSIRAVHCGGGEERQYLEGLAREWGIETNLQFLGEIPHRQVLQLMQRAKIFLHPSSGEGYSTVCLEALYAGARVISFCDPADEPVEEWQVVRDVEEMYTAAAGLLAAPPASKQVLVHTIGQNARSIMELFR